MLIVKNSGQYGDRYSTPCSNKKDGEEVVYWLDVQFKRDQEPHFYNGNKVKINVSNFFMSAYKGKDGIKPKMVIMDYEMADDNVVGTVQPVESYAPDIDPEDLPF